MKCLEGAETLDSETGHLQEHQRIEGEQQGEGASFSRTCFNGINTLAGVGILSVPYALFEGGWLCLILLFLVAILCGYTGLLLKYCMDANPHIKTYPDIGQQAFGYKGKAIVSILIFVELYLVAVEFMILEGDNLAKLFPNTGFNIVGLKIEGRQAFILMTAVLILPTTWLRNLRSLAYVSAGGVVASFIVVACVFWVGEFDGVGFHEKGKLLNLRGIPNTVSLFTFCYCGHTVFPTLCSSMKERSRFPKVLVVCFIISTINYTIMAVLGYMMYGEHIKSQVILNLPVKKISSQIAIYTTLINPITKYAIVISPIVKAIEDTPLLYKNRLLSIIMRTTIVISTVVVALTIPFFGYIMTFIGAFLGVVASILLPCVLYLKIFESARKFGMKLLLNIGIIVLGSCIGLIGTYISVNEIVNNL